MKNKYLTYCEAKDLMLKGYGIKLPEWSGYWTLDEDGDIVKHELDGVISYSPNVNFTLYDIWEVATIENCPVLREENKKTIKEKYEIVDLDILDTEYGDIHIVVYLEEGDSKVRTVTLDKFIEIVGDKSIVDEMVKEFTTDAIDELFSKCYDDMAKDAMSNNEDATNDEDDASIECNCIFCQSCK